MGCGASSTASVHALPLPDSKYAAAADTKQAAREGAASASNTTFISAKASSRPEGALVTPDSTPISSQRLTDVAIKPLVDHTVRFEDCVEEIIAMSGASGSGGCAAVAVDEPRVACAHCSRKFAESRIVQHERICSKPTAARQVWDEEKKRVEGTVFEEVRPKTPSNAAALYAMRRQLRTPSRAPGTGAEQGL